MSENAERETGPLLPLTAGQRGMWFAENMSPDYSVNTAQYLDIRDTDRTLDVETMVRMHDLGARELESAFTRLVDVDGTPMQYIDFSLPFTLEQIDLRDADDPVAAAHEWMNADYRAGVDLLAGVPLARAALLRVADDRVFWYMRGHHVLLDGFAALNSILRLVDRYNAHIAGEEFTVKPHADIAELVADDHAYATGSRRERDREYWAARAKDLPERVTLAQHAATAPLSPVNLVAGRELTPEFQEAASELAREAGGSLSMLLTAGFSAYLARMTGADDIVLSVPVTGRATAKTKRASGMVSNMLPVRASGAAHLRLLDLLDQVKLELTGVLRHQRYRFEDIRQDAGMRDAATASFGPIVNMVFFDRPIEITGAEVEYHILSSGILEDLRVNFYQASPSSPVVVDLHGNPNLYTQDEIAVHLDRFLAFFERAVAEPEAGLGEIELLTDADVATVTDNSRGPDVDYSAWGGHLLDGFERRVSQCPDAVALRFGAASLTYAEFDDARRRLAARLIADGVVPGDRVVVSLERGVDQLTAIYAAVTAGAAYVPVDPSDPQDRRDLVTTTAAARVVIDADYLAAPVGDVRAETVPVPPNAPAYVIFTSGSTGTPKGVEVPHDAVINRLAWTDEHYPLTADDTVLYKTPYTFDVSVWELFWPPAVGATTVIARPDGHRDPSYLHAVMTETGVTVAHFVPSMLDVYLDDRASRPAGELFPGSVRRIFTSGEALPGKIADRVLSAGEVDLINLYGPTEAAVDVTEHRVVAGEAQPSIGTPVPNTSAVVLDARLTPVPPGVPGELYLLGVQLAHGYVGRTGLTSERFVASPYGEGHRMYRTGDLVRWNADGGLDYLGRTDFQVKIRGQRVELGEVESVLIDHPDVDAAVAVVRSDLAATPVLVAYVRVADTGTDEPELLAWSRRRLPSHMVPSAVVVVDDFPLNSSGKTDRRALPAPELRSADYEAPQTEIEMQLAGIIADLLDVDRVGRRDNLFTLGGNSLVAARMVTRARDGLGVDLRLSDVFEATDLAELAAGAVHNDHDSESPLVHVDPRPDVIPLSTAQSRLWLVNQIDPASATYNMPGAVRLGAEVDVEAMAAAVRDVVTRHEILRTRFVALDDGTQAQVVGDVASMHDALDVTPVETDDAATAIRSVTEAGFDLTVDPPFRARLVHDAEGYVLVVVVHHIAADGYSLIPLISDLGAAYAARRSGSEPDLDWAGLQYADYALWQHDHLVGDGSATVSADLDFWRTELADLPELLPLPTDRPRPAVASGRGGYVDLVADGALTNAVRDLAKTAGVTPFSVVHAALSLVLARISGTSDIAIGVAVDGRRDDRLNRLVGMFIDTVVLRTQVSASTSVGEFLTDAHRVRARAMSRATVPFETVVDALAPSRSAAHTPLFQVGLTMLADTTSGVRDGDFTLIDTRVPAAKYDVSITVIDRADELGVEVSYATDLFDESTAAWIGEAVLRVMEQFTRTSLDVPIGSVDVVDRRTLPTLTREPSPAVDPVPLGELWDLHGAAHPGSVRDGDTVMPRAEFDAAANRLARELIARGAGPGDVVAIGTGRSIGYALAMVAITKTGAAFVSVDTTLPDERRTEILTDSRAVLAVGTAAIGDVDWLAVDAPEVLARPGDPIGADELREPVRIDHMAYLIYTSGSTGKPKAAVISHRGLANMTTNQRTVLGLDETSAVLQVASPSFDASVFEITMALCSGAALVISPADVFAGDELVSVITSGAVTHAVMTPSVMAGLDPAALPTLRTVVSVGEACPPELVDRWAGADRTFFNLYGPTESTIWATAAGPLHADVEVTIGDVVPGVGALVLDSALRPVPVGVPGELYLTGEQLALGYLDRPDLSATHFVASPFGDGARMYRTGDRVTRVPGGDLRYLGRTDFQLKIRGMRIEPGEVDGALTSHPDVAAALTVGMPGPTGDTVLVSYAAPRDGSEIDPVALRAHAAELLPAHLVPHTVVPVDGFAANTVGKVDRSALPPVDFDSGREFVAPRNDAERLVAEVFATELGVDRVSVTESFFDIGGTSLTAVGVGGRLGKLRGRRIALRDVFAHPSVAELAAFLDEADAVGDQLLRRRTATGPAPVSGTQRSMWLVNRSDPTSAAYNIALALRLEGPLDVDAMRAALGDVVERHESLRTVYPMVDGDPVQSVVPASRARERVELAVRDVVGDLPAAIGEVTGRGFDVTVDLPIRAALLRVAADQHVMVLSIHHISADGSSMAPLALDMMTAYRGRVDGTAPAWHELPIQYSDFADWQATRLATVGADGRTLAERQLDFWHDTLADAPARLELPTDRSRPTTPSFVGDAVDFTLDARLVRGLAEIGRAHGASLFMVAHAAYAVLLSRLSGQRDVVIGTPYAGRDVPTLEPLVGMFVNTLALRSRVDPAEPFTDVLDRVRVDDLAAMANADVAFDEIVSRLSAGSGGGQNALFQAMFVFQNLEFPRVELAGLTVSAEDEQLTSAKVDVQLTLFPSDPKNPTAAGDVRGQLIYATDVFDRGTAEAMVERYLHVVRAVVADADAIVGDIALDEQAEPEADDTPVNLSELVADAAAAIPTAVAAEHDGTTVTFGEIGSTIAALEAAMPGTDRDSLLTMTLMSLLPTVGPAGPEALETVLAMLRTNASPADAR